MDTKLENLKFAVDVYEHYSKISKKPYRKADYQAIKKIYDGLSYFVYKNQQHACGAILPFMKTAIELVDKK